MVTVALVISLLVVAIGLLGVIAPDRLLRMVRIYERPAGVFVAGAIRVVLGIALFLVAPESRAPEFLRVIGVVSIVAGLATPLVGPVRIGRLVDWWTARPAGVVRAWAAFAMAFGLALVWAVRPA